MTTNSQTESDILVKVQNSYDSSQWQDVITLAKEISIDSEHFLETRQLAAIAEYHLGNLDGAINHLNQIIDSGHNNSNLYLNYANFMVLANKLEIAIEYFKKSLKINSNSAVCHNNLGGALYHLNRFDEAFESFHKAIKLNPSYWEALSSIGNVYFQQKQYENSIEYYQKAYQVNPANSELINNYALALMHAGKLQLSAEFFQKSLSINPTDANLFIPLSAILQTLGQKEIARNILKAGIKETPWYYSNFQQQQIESPRISVVTFSGLQSCLYDLDENNQVKLNGGHFYSKYLIDENKFYRCKYHIQNKNIESDKSLPDIKLYINTISDPDLETESLLSLSKFLDQNSEYRIINHPDKILLTSRDKNYQRFKNIEGLIFPKTTRIIIEDQRQASETILQNYDFPFLIRLSGTQTGTSFEKIENHQDLNTSIQSLHGNEVYVIEYLDTSFSDQQSNKLFRRFRFFFIDGKMHPVTCHIHLDWNVHSIDRNSVMEKQHELAEMEKNFLENPSDIIGNENYITLSKLPEIVGLDFFGVDFSLTQDNLLVIFEVNAAMNHTYNYVDKFSYLKPHLDKITEAFHSLLEEQSNALN